jgi:hypothetical protein
MEIHGSLRIEVHADVDAGRVPCIAGAVKGVADKHGMGFRVDDLVGFYEKLKGLGVPEDLLELFKDASFVAVTLTARGVKIKLRLYIDKERRRINKIMLTTDIAKPDLLSETASALTGESELDIAIKAMQKALNVVKEALDAVKSCIQ